MKNLLIIVTLFIVSFAASSKTRVELYTNRLITRQVQTVRANEKDQTLYYTKMQKSVDEEIKGLEVRCLNLGHKFSSDYSFKSKYKMKSSFILGVTSLCSCTE